MTPQQHIDTIRALATTADADAYVANLKTPELDAILDALNLSSRGTLAQKRDLIVRMTVGARLKGEALRGL